jgi:hypothetical protein
VEFHYSIRYGAKRMPPTEVPLAENSDTEESARGNFSPAYVARLLCENVRLREEIGAWRARAITDRKDAHYYKAMHGKAVERLVEKDGQIEALKSKVFELEHRLFGRKSEGRAASIGLALIGPKRKRGQQPGAAGHGRKMRKAHEPLPDPAPAPGRSAQISHGLSPGLRPQRCAGTPGIEPWLPWDFSSSENAREDGTLQKCQHQGPSP